MPITELRIEGLRTIEKIRLKLGGLTVLIGDNGTGKSSILEALEILRRATGPRFMDEFYGVHGGLTALLRQGAKRLLLGVTVKLPAKDAKQYELDDVECIDYDLVLTPDAAFARIEESIRLKPVGESKRVARVDALKRRAARVDLLLLKERLQIDDTSTFLALKNNTEFAFSAPDEQAAWYLAHCLDRVRAHVPFETLPAWAARSLDRKSALRSPALLTPATHLEKLGLNLASAYHALKNNFGRAHWEKTLEYLQLGLGEHIDDVVTWADPGGGNIGLSLKLVGLDRPIPSAQLSDGMLSYLAFVALSRLHAQRPSIVAFDEPDLHLHPKLLMRVLDMFEAMARTSPVLLATHSDRLLDGLSDPAKSVVLCELDERGATRLMRPDREALDRWLTRYRGLGDIRGAGHAASVLTKVEPG